jgi:hypothetical protein
MYTHKITTDEFNTIIIKPASIWADIQAQNFARRAFHGHIERAAAYFAIGGEPLRGLGGVDKDFKFLAAKWTLNDFGFLHKNFVTPLTHSFRVG